FGRGRTAFRLEHPDALLDLLPRRLAAEHRAHAVLQRLDVRLEKPRLQLGEERVHGEERVRLVGREPQPRQLVARARPRLAEAVAVRLAVVLDRRVEAAAHVLDVALEGRGRHPQGSAKSGKGYRPSPLFQQSIDLVEAFEALHAGASCRKKAPGRFKKAWTP